MLGLGCCVSVNSMAASDAKRGLEVWEGWGANELAYVGR